MSKKNPPATDTAMPVQPFTWVTQYEFFVQNGIVKIAFGEGGQFFSAVAMPMDLTVQLLSNLGGVVRDQIRAQMGVEADPMQTEAPDALSRH